MDSPDELARVVRGHDSGDDVSIRVVRNGSKQTIEEEKTGERFRNSMAVAQRFGLLEYDIARAIETRSETWPTYQHFRIVSDRRR